MSTQFHSFCFLSHISWVQRQETSPKGDCGDRPSYILHELPHNSSPHGEKRT